MSCCEGNLRKATTCVGNTCLFVLRPWGMQGLLAKDRKESEHLCEESNFTYGHQCWLSLHQTGLTH